MKSERGSTGLPRYFITLDKDVVFDYPKQFVNKKLPDEMLKYSIDKNVTLKVQELYPYVTEISDISDLFREYIDTPINDLYEKEFKSDEWGSQIIIFYSKEYYDIFFKRNDEYQTWIEVDRRRSFIKEHRVTTLLTERCIKETLIDDDYEENSFMWVYE